MVEPRSIRLARAANYERAEHEALLDALRELLAHDPAVRALIRHAANPPPTPNSRVPTRQDTFRSRAERLRSWPATS